MEIRASDPFYATYAAAQERSSFVLDEGYEWHFYHPDQPIEFTTDTGGDLGLQWVVNGKTILLAKEMAASPIISETYPDLVRYKFKPTEALDVKSTFLVKSSRQALWEFEITNTSTEAQEIGLRPYIKSLKRPFGSISSSEKGAFFTHQEYPDGWTQGHDLPHEDSIRNLLVFSENNDPRVFTQWGEDLPSFPYPLSKKAEMLRLQGRTLLPGNVRNLEQAPHTRIQAYDVRNPNVLITENAAVPGLLESVINQDGYYRLDLGLLGNTNSNTHYQVSYYLEAQNLGYHNRVQANKNGRMDRIDALLSDWTGPFVPQNISLEKQDGKVRLTWTSQEPVHIYRRAYPDSKYHKVGNAINSRSWTDENSNEAYGYILTGVNEDGSPGIHSKEYTTLPKASFLTNNKAIVLPGEIAKVISYESKFSLDPGTSKTVRLARLVQPESDPQEALSAQAQTLMSEPIDTYLKENRAWIKKLELNRFEDEQTQLLYLSAANMMKQVFYPPEAKSSHNYYVFSREPTWGWGHGGQVFHESLTMMAYAPIEPESAMASQLVYEERQYPNGYINYRTGAYLDEIIELRDTLTSSAPWYAWQNYEVYKITKDESFLKKMYASSVKFYKFFVSNRDYDQDGLAEWGGHAILESVRDAAVAVWDEVAWPSNFDGVDVNSMLVMEAKALEKMALELGLAKEASKWRADHEERSRLVNQYMWDETSGFYYNVDRNDNDFSFKTPDDLKRMEIIGLLPLWAGICSNEQAARLVEHLTNPEKFWRPYGVPSLSADDSFYNDKGYWNGPVWVEWNYLIFHGLKQYGYHELAKELAQKNVNSMVEQLKVNHNLWEFYSPDEAWAGYHKTYIWAGIINRMLLDMNKIK